MSALADGDGLRPTPAPLGELLVERGLITSDQLAIALAEQQASGDQLGSILVARGFAAPTTVAAALATQHGGLLKTEYGFATGLGAGPSAPEPVAQPLASELSPLRVPPPSEAPPPVAVAAPAEDPRLVQLARERDELRAALSAETSEVERLAAEKVRLAVERQAQADEVERVTAGIRSLEAQLAELARERDGRAAAASAEIERLVNENTSLQAQLAEREAAAAPDSGNAYLAARLAELELRLADVTNRGSKVDERLDEVIGRVERLSGTLNGGAAPPPQRSFAEPVPPEPGFYRPLDAA